MWHKFTTGIVLLVFFSCGYAQKEQSTNSELLKRLVASVQANHLAPKALDDALSKQVFDLFFTKIDPNKQLFTAKDIAALQTFETTIDEALQTGNTEFFEAVWRSYQQAIKRAAQYANSAIHAPINIEETVFFNKKNKDSLFEKDEKSLQNYWAILVKKHFVEALYLISIEQPNLSFQAQKKTAKEKLQSFFDNYFAVLSNQSRQSLLEDYLNTYLSVNDYQSSYLSAAAKARWDANFNRHFVGVGMAIETTNTYPFIKNVIIGGPAWKTNAFETGNTLLAIYAQNDTWIDLAGLPLEKVLQLLKGEKGTSVQVKFKNASNQIQIVEIVRGKIMLDQAMSFIIKVANQPEKIGYIRLPRFYRGAEGSSVHIYNMLHEFKKHKVDGVIFDLRNNQGGSAGEARTMLNYLLGGKQLMQSLYQGGDHRIYEGDMPTAFYEGKLLVLVNERSSSASELFAGTLQDYNRAIIVGNQTFGKGTIQRFFDLSNETDSLNYGQVKLTIGSFYTGKGRSTQHKGVSPDIVLANQHSFQPTGERAIPQALKFEDLVSQTNNKNTLNIEKLQKASKERLTKQDYFKRIVQKSKEPQNQSINLNYEKYKAAQQNQNVSIPSTIIEELQIDLLASNINIIEKEQAWKSKMERDHYIYECFWIFQDYLFFQ